MNRTFTLLLIFLATSCYAQFGNSGGGIEWTAQWITLPNSDNEKSALYHFRKSINMESIPESYKVHISADNRYKLYVNGQLVSVGPYWGDIENWNYETVELAPYLKPGKNVLSAEVWNEAELRPVAQFSYKTALILQLSLIHI